MSNLTIDQIISSVANSRPGHRGANPHSSVMIYEMDIVLTSDQYRYIKTNSDRTTPVAGKSRRKKRKALKTPVFRWPNKIIPYKVLPIFTLEDEQVIKKSIEEWETYTCVRFRKASSEDVNFLVIGSGDGCYSYIGMNGGAQFLSLAPGCVLKPIVVHELGHAVGFFHEQSRPDRDDYITIVTENVESNKLSNFEKIPLSSLDTFRVPYDYTSVMHYGSTYFSKNGLTTIRTKNPSFQDVIGNSKGLSFMDIKLANLMYTCQEGCPFVKCPEQGFIGQDCNCLCPGDSSTVVTRCEASKVISRVSSTPEVIRPRTPNPILPEPTPEPACVDADEICQYYSKLRLCQTRYDVRASCPVSCGSCPELCRDRLLQCQELRYFGYCEILQDYMAYSCPLTCNLCYL
ncbi:zinc metalloproteinase nas-13 [Biomphalaria pfeifferi]|uniref:Metalloendopeptidase n=1 Tax=Biomphalaria pfeifferi TaxID=112525 RepID=A0AAD8EZ60_BIOPF|nr:zinc metalloproteinase nas-13 [Biomphalaria pfeifferi]